MKKRKTSCGTVVTNYQQLKNHTKFVSPFYRVQRINTLVSIFILTTGALVFVINPPSHTISLIWIICYVVSIVVGEIFDGFDHRVYVSEENIAIKSNGITKKYEWKYLEQHYFTNDSTIAFVFVHGEVVQVKRILRLDQLMKTLKLHNIQS